MDSTAERNFPLGLRVIVVDDDLISLNILNHMLVLCQYEVTPCDEAARALCLLRENKDGFDVVISDVHMPGMNGFELLELVGLETPVIMISADAETDTVMRGVQNGACDYLVKPLRMKELRNIWQHVLRRKNSNELEHSGRLEDTRINSDAEDASENDVADGTSKSHKKKKGANNSSRKSRVAWSDELNNKFKAAVYQLGIDKAVPKRILELMNVPGLTRENVASHLQKFRNHLKKASGVQRGSGSGQVSPHPLPEPHLAVNMQPSCCLPNQTSNSFQVGTNPSPMNPYSLMGHPQMLTRFQGRNNRFLMNQNPVIVPSQSSASFQAGTSHVLLNRNSIPTGPSQALNSFQPGFTKQKYSIPTGPSQALNSFQPGFTNQKYSIPTGPSQALNSFQPCFTNQKSIGTSPLPLSSFHAGINSVFMNQSSTGISTQPLANFWAGNNAILANQKSTPVTTQSSMSFHAENSLIPTSQNSIYLVPVGMGQGLNEDLNNVGMLNNYSISGSVSLPMSCTDSSTNWMADTPDNICPSSGFPARMLNLGNYQDSGTGIETLSYQGQGRDLGFVSESTFIPNPFSVDGVGTSRNNSCGDEEMAGDNSLVIP